MRTLLLCHRLYVISACFTFALARRGLGPRKDVTLSQLPPSASAAIFTAWTRWQCR